MEKIGIGIITCNRFEFFKKCVDSITDVDCIVTVNDGSPYKYYGKSNEVVEHKQNVGVGITKNDALRYLLDKKCHHIFLIEDDMEITDNNVFEKYIRASKESGLQHLLFQYHCGGSTKILSKKYINEEIDFFRRCVGSFNYYTSDVLNEVGVFDEKYVNASEHVDHTYRIIMAGFLPVFGAFPDITRSFKYIKEQGGLDASCIRNGENVYENTLKSLNHFSEMHGTRPMGLYNPISMDVLEYKLNEIREKFSKNK